MSGTTDADGVQRRSDAGVGGAIHQEAGTSDGVEAVQSEPVLDQNNASIQEKLDGIAAQTRVDLGDESHDRYEEVLRQRLSDADIQLTDDEVTSLARRSAPATGGGGV